MQTRIVLAAFVLATGCVAATAQQASQPQLKIDGSNRILTVQAGARVTAAPDLAIVHLGFETQLGDAKQVYADGARISNTIIAALKQAGIEESAIHSESQSLDHDWAKPHKFKLTEQWTVRAPAGRAAEILDVAINAGATSSGQIDWAMKDRNALEEKVLDEAMAQVRERAAVLAKGMGVKLGALEYVTNEMAAGEAPVWRDRAMAPMANKSMLAAPPPLAIEPEKISIETTVYAVFAIE
jgi:uncharacterized protein YggE